jgi:hypothetical protein
MINTWFIVKFTLYWGVNQETCWIHYFNNQIDYFPLFCQNLNKLSIKNLKLQHLEGHALPNIQINLASCKNPDNQFKKCNKNSSHKSNDKTKCKKMHVNNYEGKTNSRGIWIERLYNLFLNLNLKFPLTNWRGILIQPKRIHAPFLKQTIKIRRTKWNSN